MSATYSIAAVAALTGLSVDTLRAWERRHRIVTPLRSGSGIREYDNAEVARLQLARSAVGLGHPIRAIAALSNGELRNLVRGSGDVAVEAERNPALDRVADALRRYDVARARALLASAALLLGPDAVVLELLAPLMNRVGAMWEARDLSIAQEHIASSLVRDVVGALARSHATRGGAPMLFATPPDEPHELGIVLAACLAQTSGVATCVLGSNVPLEEVLRAAEHTRTGTVVIGVARNMPRHSLGRYLAGLSRDLPKRTRLWVGGDVAAPALRSGKLRAEFVPSLADFARRVARSK